MRTRTTRAVTAVIAVVLVASVVGGCRTVRPGARCRTTEYAQSGNYVMVCRNGRWTRFLTKAQATSAMVALLQARTTTTTTTTAPPAPSTPAVQPPIFVPATTLPPPPQPPKAVAIAVTQDHACAALDDGTIRCWGSNNTGQLGNGEGPFPLGNAPPQSRDTPVEVVGMADAVDVGVGLGFSCALRTGGTVSCWGDNVVGQLGTDTRPPVAPGEVPPLDRALDSNVPLPIAGLTDVVRLEVGYETACAVRSNGDLWCWGRGGGGTGGSDDAFTPLLVPDGTSVPAMAGPTTFDEAMAKTGCGLGTGGIVYCWNVIDPNQVPWWLGSTAVDRGLRDVVELAGWREQACARTVGGQVWCFGHNDLGQLGNGTALSSGGSQVPVRVHGIG